MAMMIHNEKNGTGEKTLYEKKPSFFIKFMKWIEKGQKNQIQCVS